jgi:hypothetical protein
MTDWKKKLRVYILGPPMIALKLLVSPLFFLALDLKNKGEKT